MCRAKLEAWRTISSGSHSENLFPFGFVTGFYFPNDSLDSSSSTLLRMSIFISLPLPYSVKKLLKKSSQKQFILCLIVLPYSVLLSTVYNFELSIIIVLL